MANGMDLATYLTRFQWDMAKYPIKQSLKNLSDMIAKQVTRNSGFSFRAIETALSRFGNESNVCISPGNDEKLVATGTGSNPARVKRKKNFFSAKK
jgi:hypothetical protein